MLNFTKEKIRGRSKDELSADELTSHSLVQAVHDDLILNQVLIGLLKSTRLLIDALLHFEQSVSKRVYELSLEDYQLFHLVNCLTAEFLREDILGLEIVVLLEQMLVAVMTAEHAVESLLEIGEGHEGGLQLLKVLVGGESVQVVGAQNLEVHVAVLGPGDYVFLEILEFGLALEDHVDYLVDLLGVELNVLDFLLPHLVDFLVVDQVAAGVLYHGACVTVE